jgi:hypothetical protein
MSREQRRRPGEGAWSDSVAFEVKAFQRLAVSLTVTAL